MIQFYLPCCMLVIVSWVSFWLDANAVPARVMLGITTLLTMSTQTSAINQSLPPVSYTKVQNPLLSPSPVMWIWLLNRWILMSAGVVSLSTWVLLLPDPVLPALLHAGDCFMGVLLVGFKCYTCTSFSWCHNTTDNVDTNFFNQPVASPCVLYQGNSFSLWFAHTSNWYLVTKQVNTPACWWH